MLISRLADDFTDYMLTERGASAATVKAYSSTLRLLTDFLASHQHAPDFEQLTTPHLRSFIAQVKRTGVSNATIARHVHAIRSFWRFVVETYDFGHNAALPLRAPKPDHRVPQVLSADECQSLIDASEKNYYRLYRIRDRVLLKLMLVIGLRRGEVIALRVGDYSSADRTLNVVMSKGRRSRVVPLPPDLCTDINAWLGARPAAAHDYLLTTRTGNPLSPTCLYRAIGKLAKSAGLEHAGITPHVLRHTAATLVLRNSGDLLATSRLLGHSSVAVTGDTYCHLTNDDIRRAVSYHPLAGKDAPTISDCETEDLRSYLRVPDDRKGIVTEVEEMVASALGDYRQGIAQKPELEERFRNHCLVEAIRDNVRPRTPVPEDVVHAIAWEGRVVVDYSMAEHLRMVALRDVLEEISDSARCGRPWSQLFPEIAARISGEPAATLEPWQCLRLDEIGTALVAAERDDATSLTHFTQVLAGIAMLEAFGENCLLMAQIAANIATHVLRAPLTFFPAYSMPLLGLAIEHTRHGDASVLYALVASRVTELCCQATS